MESVEPTSFSQAGVPEKGEVHEPSYKTFIPKFFLLSGWVGEWVGKRVGDFWGSIGNVNEINT
jgi:beta-glucanase (GH16 family)